MTHIEQTGKTVDEATRLALEQLGVTEDEVDVEILEEGSKGFLGLRQTPARVRVTLKAVAVPPKREEAAARPRPRQRQRPRPRRERKMVEERKEVEETVEIQSQETQAEPKAIPAPISAEDLQHSAELGLEVLQKILDGIGAGGQASVKSANDAQVALEVQGGDTGVLIGKHGQTINAIQYLVGVITNKQTGHRVRLTVDAENYRTRREEALHNQAIDLAGKVKESGQEAVLESLTASERRIIHTALADDPGVYTYSEGVEPDRHVVISPKK